MNCQVCGSGMEDKVTDLPFKVAESSIVIIKGLPITQCSNCPEYLVTDRIMARVEQILSAVDESAELEVVRYAA